MNEKRPMLCVYDYGQGGIWLLLDATRAEEIETRYPMLTAYPDQPDWMTPEQKEECVRNCESSGFHWDIDEPPTGWLKDLDETSTHN